MSPPSRPKSVDLREAEDVERLAGRLDPRRNRAEVIAGLERAFAGGVAPDPWPSGPLAGRLLGTTTWRPWDAFVLRVAGWWMPWLGKAFDAERRTGINRFRPTDATARWLTALFPGHQQTRLLDRIEAFPFRNAVGAGELDPGVQVLKIDYDFEANPALIRHILDELVQIAPGRYLGKVLFRVGSTYHRIGFFSLSA